jgi:hypothetical protein
MEKICARCGETKEENKFRSSFGDATKNVCKGCSDLLDRTRKKLEVLEHLGSSCACCGETNPLFLTIDHVQNDGSEHRKRERLHTWMQLVSRIKREGWPRGRYQVLCYNCNVVKGHYGSCPHQSGQSAEQILDHMRMVVLQSGKRHRFFQESVRSGHKFVENRPWKSREMLGNKFARRKLTEEQVREMRRLRESGATQLSLCERFGVTRVTVKKILSRTTWNHV